MCGSFDHLRFEVPFVRQDQGIRSLHFTHGEVQSSMRVSHPDELQVDYTRTMMGFLLLNPRPRQITMIGLGGGSLAKFCHRHLRSARVTVVENNPEVIALRREFGIPDDNERLAVLTDDGALHVATVMPEAIDVLLVDGFDHTGQPPQLCSQAFYDSCRRALAPGGLLVVNLHIDHPEHDLMVCRIAASFDGNAMEMIAGEKANGIVLAGRDRPVTLEALHSREWANVLGTAARLQLSAEFACIGWNAHSLRTPLERQPT
jgi:spermidine synthase